MLSRIPSFTRKQLVTIFEPFTRAKSSSRAKEGTGLELPILDQQGKS